MTSPPRNLVNLKDATKGYAARTVLADVTLGVSAGDRIGIVGRNGDGAHSQTGAARLCRVPPVWTARKGCV
mgnify:CR=1 FL=1